MSLLRQVIATPTLPSKPFPFIFRSLDRATFVGMSSAARTTMLIWRIPTGIANAASTSRARTTPTQFPSLSSGLPAQDPHFLKSRTIFNAVDTLFTCFWVIRWAYFLNDAVLHNTTYWDSEHDKSAFMAVFRTLPLPATPGNIDVSPWLEASELSASPHEPK